MSEQGKVERIRYQYLMGRWRIDILEADLASGGTAWEYAIWFNEAKELNKQAYRRNYTCSEEYGTPAAAASAAFGWIADAEKSEIARASGTSAWEDEGGQ